MKAENRFFSKLSSIIVIALTLLIFVGWQFDIATFRQLIPGAPPTTPLTALLLLCLSSALFLLNKQVDPPETSWFRWLIWLLAGTAVFISLFTVVQYLLFLTPSIELWLYRSMAMQMQTDFPGRPSPHTAVNGILSSLAILTAALPQPKIKKLSPHLALLSAISPWIALFGYITLTNPFHSLPSNPQTGMSPLTATAYLIIAFGILACQPEQGIIGLLRSNSPGGALARRLLPTTIVLTLIFGWGIQVVSNQGWLDHTLAFAISWGVGSLVFVALILRQSAILHEQYLERKKAVEEREEIVKVLAREEEKSRTLLETAPDALVIVNEKGRIVIVNQQTEILFQMKREELIDQPIEILLPERFKEGHPTHRKHFFAQPKARPMGVGLELYGRRRDGHEFPVEVSLNILHSPEGNLALAAIRDVTEQKLAAETLRQFNQKLEERAKEMTAELQEHSQEIQRANLELEHYTKALERSNLDLQQFAYVASHDLQTPLRSISGFIQLLQEAYEDQLDEQAQEWITYAVENTIRMQTLIRDILAYSRVESPTHAFKAVDLNEVFYEIKALLKHELETKRVQLTTVPLPQVVGNRTQLVLLLQNLIVNGIKYNRCAVPEIHISAERSNSKQIISVRDNGIGIEPAYTKRIFEIFRRLHTQEEYSGNGIGLAICRRIVERHGGEIWLESIPNQGSTFYFSLPSKGVANGQND